MQSEQFSPNENFSKNQRILALRERAGQALVIFLKNVVKQLELPNQNQLGKDSNAYESSLVFILRLLIILFAESRKELPIANPVYRKEYSLSYLLDMLSEGSKFAEKRQECLPTTVYERIHSLIQLMSSSGSSTRKERRVPGLPVVESTLFDLAAYPDLDVIEIPDTKIFKILEMLAFTKDGIRVDYSSFNFLDLGHVYEHLLSFGTGGNDISINEPQSKSILKENWRKTSGSFYTPELIRRFMVKTSLELILREKLKNAQTISDRVKICLDLRILDPAMGTGHFLVDCILCLISQIHQIINSSSVEEKSSLNEWFDEEVAIRHIATKCVFGVDINPISVDMAKFALNYTSGSLFAPLKDFISNLRLGNSLLGFVNLQEATEMYNSKLCQMGKLFHWNIEFPMIFESKDQVKGFDLVISNPPYVRSDDLPKDLLNAYKLFLSHSFASRQKTDLFYFFIERGVNLLRKNGRLCYIIPNRIVSNVAATRIRKYLFDYFSIEQLIDLSNYRDEANQSVFPEVNVFPVILVVKAIKKSQVYQFSTIDGPVGLTTLEKTPIPISLCRKINYLLLMLSSEEAEFLQRMFSNPKVKQLGKIAHVGEGMRGKTITREEYEKIPKKDQERFVQEFRGKNISRYHVDGFNGYFYMARDTPNLKLPSEFRREALEGKIKRINRHLQFLPKIVISELSSELRAAFENKGLCTYGGVYFIAESEIDLKTLTGVLNSIIPSVFFKLLFKTGRWGKSFKFRTSYLNIIPVPDFKDKKKLENQIIEVVSELQTITQQIFKLKKRFEDLVTKKHQCNFSISLKNILEEPPSYIKRKLLIKAGKKPITSITMLLTEWEAFQDQILPLVKRLSNFERSLQMKVIEAYELTEEDRVILERIARKN